MKNEIAFHYKKSIHVLSYLKHNKNEYDNLTIQSFFHELMNFGYIPSEDFVKIAHLLDIPRLYNAIIPILQDAIGDTVHKVMYPNFPEEVQEMDDLEWIINAIVHYQSDGELLPDHEVQARKYGLEKLKYKELGITTNSELEDVFNTMLKSSDSITDFDKKALNYCLKENWLNLNLDEIPFAETRCIVLAHYLEMNDSERFNELLENMTDILRVCTYLSGGDVSLASNTKFKNFKRPVRRFLTKSLEFFWDSETAYRHKNKWIKLLHNLHVGEYSNLVWEKAKILRENEKIQTFNSLVEKNIRELQIQNVIKLLKQKPSEFARRLDHLIRIDQNNYVLDEFKKVISKVPTKILVQMYGHFVNRNKLNKKVINPKGLSGKAVILEQKPGIDFYNQHNIIIILSNEMKRRFATKAHLGKVWIDKNLDFCPVPSSMRAVKDGLVTVPRGTQFDMPDGNTLRFFVHWIGERIDIDLSASFHDNNFKLLSNVSYQMIRCPEFGAYHSGDIVSAPAPDGASEFIDIDIDIASEKCRYVVMNVFAFSNETFNQLETAFVGWMKRDKPECNDIFLPKTVQYKLDLVNETRYVCPIIFDLLNRKIIFANITSRGQSTNNVNTNKASIEDILYAAVHPGKMTLHHLFTLHAEARGEVVEQKKDADFTCGFDDCDITPHDWLEIQTAWMS